MLARNLLVFNRNGMLKAYPSTVNMKNEIKCKDKKKSSLTLRGWQAQCSGDLFHKTKSELGHSVFGFIIFEEAT